MAPRSSVVGPVLATTILLAIGALADNRRPGCGACRLHKEIRERTLEFIQADILMKLGFSSPPNVTGKDLPKPSPQHIQSIELANSMQSDEPSYTPGASVDEEYDDYHFKTEKVISYAKPYPRLRHSWRDRGILHFSFSDSIMKYLVGSAYLYVYVSPAERRPAPNEVVYLDVFKIYKSQEHPDEPGMKRVHGTKVQQPVGEGKWVKIDVTNVVSEWFRSPRENIGFIVTGTINGKKVIVTDTQPHSNVPYVEVTTKEGKRRTRRNVSFDCDERNVQTVCCRYPMVVDFESFGYDFIIAPRRYEAYYCAGECPHITMQRHPHTHLVTLASNDSVTRCCTPRKMGSINILYFDLDYNVLYGNLPGMVVEKCGC